MSIIRGGGVRIQFIKELTGIDDVNVEVTLQLIGLADNPPPPEEFLPAPSKSVTYKLDSYSIRGQSVKGTHPRLRCEHTGDTVLFPAVDLVITAQ